MQVADLTSPGVDVNWLVPAHYNLLLSRRADGSWAVSLGHTNPRRRQGMIRAEGPELEDCLRELQARADAKIWREAEKYNPHQPVS